MSLYSYNSIFLNFINKAISLINAWAGAIISLLALSINKLKIADYSNKNKMSGYVNKVLKLNYTRPPFRFFDLFCNF